MVPMVLISVIAYRIAKNEKATPAEQPAVKPESQNKMTSGFDGARLVFRSRSLLAIAGIVCLYEITSNIIDFQLTGIASIVIQLFLTSFILTRFGLRPALLFLPISIAAASARFLLLPTLIFAAILSSSDNALNYSINQSAKEVLYSPTSLEVTYNAKAFIDMFVQRFAKALSVLLNLTFAAFAGGRIRWLSLATLALPAIWIALMTIASKEFQREARREKRQVEQESSELVRS